MTIECNNVTPMSYRRIHEVIHPWVENQPAALALQDAGSRLTYGDLESSVQATAQQLQALGVRAGDRVLLVAENCAAAALTVLAASVLDAWAVIVNARLSPREIDNFIDHSGARRVLYTIEVSADAKAHAERAGAVLQTWPGTGSLAAGPLNEAAVPEPVHHDPAEQVAAMIYTSGTSGSPKGVMLTHANLLFIADINRQLRRVGPLDKVYGVLPMAHVVGLSTQLIGSLSSGSALLLEPRFTPESLVRSIREESLTLLIGVPAMYARLLDWCRQHGASLDDHRLRVIGTAGSPLTPQLKQDVEDMFGLTLQNGYGLTETSPTVAQTRLDAARPDCSVGQPIPGIEIRIVDPQGMDVEAGNVGELWVRGPNLMKGYYRNVGLTREAVNSDGWFNTGDMARQEPDGALFIVGRTKELIIRSGFNVYPVEVEQVLNSHPLVVQSAVVGRQVEGNEEVVAFVELAANETLSAEVLNAYARERLSPYKVPSEIRFLSQLPSAPTGKILKNDLKQQAAVHSS